MRARWGWIAAAGTVTMTTPAAAQDCDGMLFFASSTVVIGSALIDIATASASANHYNTTHLAIAPTYDPRRQAFGFAASLTFGRARRVPPRPVARRVQTPAPARKSPATATFLSFGATAIPVAIAFEMKSEGAAYPFLAGVIVGPSVGHFYAEQHARGLMTMGVRAGATLIGISSIAGCFAD